MENNYAIVSNNIVVNVALSTPEFAQEQGWVLLTGDAWIGWKYIDGEFFPPIGPSPEQMKEANKEQAESLLQATDWTATVDINNPTYSNPYLGNQDEFLAYRSNVRKIAVNPPVTVTEWPIIPKEVWVTVPTE